jgi:preprotein translocase subunit Sec63
MVVNILRLLAASLLPDLATLLVPPTRRRHVFSLVIVVVVLYNLIHGLRSVRANFYQRLRVSPDADEHTLRVAFRQFAKKFHPDKAGSDEAFILARDAFEALKNPVVRFAYDRWAEQCRVGLVLMRG